MRRNPYDSQDYCCVSPKTSFKFITLLSLILAIIVSYLSITIIYTAWDNDAAVEGRKLQIERNQEDLEEEMRPSSKEMNSLLATDLVKHNLHNNGVSHVILVSGFLAFAAGCIQFITGVFVYFNFKDKDKDSEEFWSFVSCAVFFCLLSCLILLLCLDTSQVPYFAQEIVFIIAVTTDMIFSMYSIFLILSSV